jgi:GTPase
MDAKAAAREELRREREAGLWTEDDDFEIDRTGDTREQNTEDD